MMMLMHWGNCMQTMHDIADSPQRSCRQASNKISQRPEEVFEPSMMLNAAILLENPSAVAHALKLKPNVNNVGTDGMTPLTLCLNMHSKQTEQSLEILKLLLAYGADANTREDRTNSKRLPLHIACRLGHLKIIDILLEHGANPDAIDSHTYTTPLQYGLELLINAKSTEAVQMYSDVVLRLLQHSELDITYTGFAGPNPLQLAILSSQPQIIMTIICKGTANLSQRHIEEALNMMKHYKGSEETREEIVNSLKGLSINDSPRSLQELSRAVIRSTMSRRLSATGKLHCPTHIKKFILLANFDWVQCPTDADNLNEADQSALSQLTTRSPQQVQAETFLKYC